MNENSPHAQPLSTNSSAATHGSDAFLKKAHRYYEKINADEIDEEYFALFAEDVEVFYPKFGIARGLEAIAELGRRVQSIVSDFAFDLDQFVYTCQANRVAVEIVEHGALKTAKPSPTEKRVSANSAMCSNSTRTDKLPATTAMATRTMRRKMPRAWRFLPVAENAGPARRDEGVLICIKRFAGNTCQAAYLYCLSEISLISTITGMACRDAGMLRA